MEKIRWLDRDPLPAKSERKPHSRTGQFGANSSTSAKKRPVIIGDQIGGGLLSFCAVHENAWRVLRDTKKMKL